MKIQQTIKEHQNQKNITKAELFLYYSKLYYAEARYDLYSFLVITTT